MSKIYGIPVATPINPEKLKGDTGLPEVSAADSGKVLAVVGGKWQAYQVEIPEEVPKPTSADNGKILQVVDGAYSLVAMTDVSEVGM